MNICTIHKLNIFVKTGGWLVRNYHAEGRASTNDGRVQAPSLFLQFRLRYTGLDGWPANNRSFVKGAVFGVLLGSSYSYFSQSLN